MALLTTSRKIRNLARAWTIMVGQRLGGLALLVLVDWLGHERHRGIVSALSDELGDFVLGIAQAGLRVTKKPLISETVIDSSFSVGLLEGMAFHEAVQDSSAEQKNMLFRRAGKLLKNLERKRVSMPWKKTVDGVLQTSKLLK
jgi:hypothetical protein